MVVARELVTRLSFIFDRSKLDTFERSITGFKNSIVLTAGDIAKAVSASFDFLANLAQSRINLKDIADFSGLATEEFVAMRIAAQQLGVQTSTFDTAVRNLTKDLKLARVGEGAFLRFAQQVGKGIRLPFSTDNLTNFHNALEDIFTVVSNIADKSEKLRILQNIFKTDESGTAQLLRLIDQGLGTFKQAIENSREAAKMFAEQESAALKLQNQIDRLGAAWTKFAETLMGTVFPVLSLVLEAVNDAFQAIGTVTNYIAALPKKVVTFATENVPELVKEAIGNFESNINNPQNGFGFKDLLSNFMANQHPTVTQPNSAALTANTTINVTVPQGTTQEQSNYIADEVKQAVQMVIDENTRQIISSNPMVE